LGLLFKRHNLQGIVAENETRLFEILNANIELGAIFLSQEDQEAKNETFSLLRGLHFQRAELPIFYRQSKTQDSAPIPDDLASICTFIYSADELGSLENAISKHIFSPFYPLSLIQQFQNISRDAICGLINKIEVDISTPYLVHDKIIYGQICSLIRLESDWCNGYMMLQAPEQDLIISVTSGRTPLQSAGVNFRSAHDVLGELTNLIWGQIKANILDAHDQGKKGLVAELPLILNENRKYITFGNTDPTLCLEYAIKEEGTGKKLLEIHQKFLFSMTWRPRSYLESPADVENLLKQGDLVFL
jgi:hypothetical protein